MKKLIAALVFVISFPMHAEDAVDQRQENQEQRIEEGVKDGSLNDREAKRLEHQQKRIEKREAKMRADGELSPKEKAKLNKMQKRASKTIARKKHNKR